MRTKRKRNQRYKSIDKYYEIIQTSDAELENNITIFNNEVNKTFMSINTENRNVNNNVLVTLENLKQEVNKYAKKTNFVTKIADVEEYCKNFIKENKNVLNTNEYVTLNVNGQEKTFINIFTLFLKCLFEIILHRVTIDYHKAIINKEEKQTLIGLLQLKVDEITLDYIKLIMIEPADNSS